MLTIRDSLKKPARRNSEFGRHRSLITKEQLEDYTEEIIQTPISIYSLDLRTKGNYQLIVICLDHLENSYGSVSLGICETFSNTLRGILDEKHPEANYTLQVSSPGAERELRLPGDLERFSHLPMKLCFLEDEKKIIEVVKILKVEEEVVELEQYTKKKSKTSRRYHLRKTDIIKGNLYLDI